MTLPAWRSSTLPGLVDTGVPPRTNARHAAKHTVVQQIITFQQLSLQVLRLPGSNALSNSTPDCRDWFCAAFRFCFTCKFQTVKKVHPLHKCRIIAG
jgi:hypothetical protein